MIVNDLLNKLSEMGYRTGAANICGEGAPEGLTISRCGNWEVYFMEKGEKFDLSIHEFEAIACNDFLRRAAKELESGDIYFRNDFADVPLKL